MDKKIIFFDIDGTVFDLKLGVSELTKKAIKELIENGHIPVICTGRTRAMIPDFLVDMGFFGIIAGAGTYIEYQNEIIHHKVMDHTFGNAILTILKDNHIHYVVEGPEFVYYDDTDKSEEYGFVMKIIKSLGYDKVKALNEGFYQFNKLSCSLQDNSKLDCALSLLKDRLYPIHHEGTNMVELAPNGYNKAEGIKRLIEHLNIDKKNTYAFGDSTNDLEMLEYVEYGVAMGNSYPEVLKRAKYKTKTIEEDGIYYGLKDFKLI